MNVSDLSNATTAARTLGNLVLVTPQGVKGYQPKQPSNKTGATQEPPSTLLFHYEGENIVDLQSDITDHYIEDNTAIQDQVALKPEIVRVSGYIGELNDVVPSVLAPLRLIADKLTTIGAYTPSLSASALIAYNRAKLVYDTVEQTSRSLVDTWNWANGVGGLNEIGGQGIILPDGTRLSKTYQDKQQTMFQLFYGYWRNRYLFDVQTPWAIFKNMAIQSLTATQDEQTRVITEFSVTFKMLRFATTNDFVRANSSLLDNSQYRGRLNSQGATTIDFGSQVPKTVTETPDSLWS